MNRIVLKSDGAARTRAIGRCFGRALAGGHVIALIGPLGSGKTTLVKGIGEGAGVADARQVNSPTFVIVNEYEAMPGGRSLRIHHIDAYRLGGGDDLEAIGFDEMLSEGAVIVEWADRVADVMPADLLTVTMASMGDETRELTCSATGARAEALLADAVRDV